MRAFAVALAATSFVAFADEYVMPSPTPAEVGRFGVVRASTITIKVDTMTGGTWYLCASARKGRSAWCRFKDLSGLSAGPVGRYRVIDGTPIVLVDSVSGRSWGRCEAPTPERGEAWCQIDE